MEWYGVVWKIVVKAVAVAAGSFLLLAAVTPYPDSF